MLEEKDTLTYTPQFAMQLAAHLIERAKLDLLLHSTNQTSICLVGWDKHSVSTCATDFLTRVEDYKVHNPEADSVEIAMEILSWLH